MIVIKSFAVVITSELENYVNKLNLKVVNGKCYVEVQVLGINKGTFVSYLIKENLSNGHIPDFIMCVDDDISDEKMFRYLKEKEKENELKNYSKNIKINSVVVGKKPSNAMYYVNNTKDVQEMIEEFVKTSHQMGGSISTFNLNTAMQHKEMNIEIEEEKRNEA